MGAPKPQSYASTLLLVAAFIVACSYDEELDKRVGRIDFSPLRIYVETRGENNLFVKQDADAVDNSATPYNARWQVFVSCQGSANYTVNGDTTQEQLLEIADPNNCECHLKSFAIDLVEFVVAGGQPEIDSPVFGPSTQQLDSILYLLEHPLDNQNDPSCRFGVEIKSQVSRPELEYDSSLEFGIIPAPAYQLPSEGGFSPASPPLQSGRYAFDVKLNCAAPLEMGTSDSCHGIDVKDLSYAMLSSEDADKLFDEKTWKYQGIEDQAIWSDLLSGKNTVAGPSSEGGVEQPHSVSLYNVVADARIDEGEAGGVEKTGQICNQLALVLRFGPPVTKLPVNPVLYSFQVFYLRACVPSG